MKVTEILSGGQIWSSVEYSNAKLSETLFVKLEACTELAKQLEETEIAFKQMGRTNKQTATRCIELAKQLREAQEEIEALKANNS